MGKKRGMYKIKGEADISNEWVMFALTQLAMGDVTQERMEQLKRWTYEHDDEHSPEDWAHMINERTESLSLGVPKKKARQLLVEIGALAVAALEAMQRDEIRKAKATGPARGPVRRKR